MVLLGNSWKVNKFTIKALLDGSEGFAKVALMDMCTQERRCILVMQNYMTARTNRPNYNKRIDAMTGLTFMDSFRSSQMMAYLMSPLFLTLCVSEYSRLLRPEYVTKALENLVLMTATQMSHKAYGDFPLKLIFVAHPHILDEVFPQFIGCGGIQSIISGSVTFQSITHFDDSLISLSSISTLR